ncbi:MAG: hypothetical protein GXY08_11825 [Ruminococcus sp.]|nr:hypothetical protein [Ruminococcus sp.]
MEKNYDILKVITHADGGEEYSKNVSKYPSNEDSVAVRGYGVDANNPATAMMQFDTMAKYHGNEGKNQYIQYMMSFLKETAPDSETANANSLELSHMDDTSVVSVFFAKLPVFSIFEYAMRYLLKRSIATLNLLYAATKVLSNCLMCKSRCSSTKCVVRYLLDKSMKFAPSLFIFCKLRL